MAEEGRKELATLTEACALPIASAKCEIGTQTSVT